MDAELSPFDQYRLDPHNYVDQAVNVRLEGNAYSGTSVGFFDQMRADGSYVNERFANRQNHTAFVRAALAAADSDDKADHINVTDVICGNKNGDCNLVQQEHDVAISRPAQQSICIPTHMRLTASIAHTYLDTSTSASRAAPKSKDEALRAAN